MLSWNQPYKALGLILYDVDVLLSSRARSHIIVVESYHFVWLSMGQKQIPQGLLVVIFILCCPVVVEYATKRTRKMMCIFVGGQRTHPHPLHGINSHLPIG